MKRRARADGLRASAGYAWTLPLFLRRQIGAEQSRRWIEEALARREENFLAQVRDAIFANDGSPYRALFDQAGIEHGDVTHLVEGQGLEGALGTLFDAGVRVTLDELKGRRPIERPGLSLEARPEDFDNPRVGVTFAASTGGSRGPATPVKVDIDLLEYEIAYDWLASAAQGGLDHMPVALWRSINAGLKEPIRFAKRGIRVEKWFALNQLGRRTGTAKRSLLTTYTLLASHLFGTPMPFPEYVPAEDGLKVARWLALKCSQGTPAFMSANATSSVRLCLAAREHDLDISGTLFRIGGEPYTEAKAAVVAERGCRAIGNYSITEIGRVGVACGDPQAIDDVHLVTDKLAVIQRDQAVRGNGQGVGALRFTTLHPRARKILINAEVGDYAVLEERECGCALGAVGLARHAHTIRSYEKLTSEGVNFLGSDLIRLLEQVLPTRFGGTSADYQLVEVEVEGLPKIQVVVSPRLGAVDEDGIIATVLAGLGEKGRGERGMAKLWKHGDTLRVDRREPYVTGAGKVLPLHVLRS
ncbi:MAG: hypothetical protein ACXWZ1_01155 [Gaiellaceae bacterium]